MKTLTNIVEGKGSVELLQDEIQRYLRTMNPRLPKRVQAVTFILNKYPQINTKEMILDIRDGKFKLFEKLNILPDDLRDLQKMLKKLEGDIKLLPQFLTAHQRQALEDSKLTMDDLTMDLETEKGRNYVVKQYAPLVYKIANQFVGKTGLDKAELISGGLMGLVNAMNTYNKPEEREANGQPGTQTFKQYAAYMIRFQILTDINEYSRAVSVSDYMQKKALERGENIEFQSIDSKYGTDEEGDDIKIDRIIDLSETPDYNLEGDTNTRWKTFFNVLEKKFSQRDCNLFYRLLGVNGYKKEKGRDIAKELSITPSAVTQTFKKMISWITNNPEALEIAKSIQELYTESRLSDMFNSSKEFIIESLRNDDIFILLEEINKWNNPKVFTDAVNKATDMLSVEDATIIYKCIMGGNVEIDKYFKKYKSAIVSFLTNLYPAENFKKCSDFEIKDTLVELNNTYIKLKLHW